MLCSRFRLVPDRDHLHALAAAAITARSCAWPAERTGRPLRTSIFPNSNSGFIGLEPSHARKVRIQRRNRFWRGVSPFGLPSSGVSTIVGQAHGLRRPLRPPARHWTRHIAPVTGLPSMYRGCAGTHHRREPDIIALVLPNRLAAPLKQQVGSFELSRWRGGRYASPEPGSGRLS